MDTKQVTEALKKLFDEERTSTHPSVNDFEPPFATLPLEPDSSM